MFFYMGPLPDISAYVHIFSRHFYFKKWFSYRNFWQIDFWHVGCNLFTKPVS